MIGRALEDETIGTLLSRAVGEAKEVAQAEIGFYRASASAKLGEAKNAIIFAVGALICLHLALIGLVVGLLLILQSALGPIWASVIVVGVLAIATGLLGWLALGQVRKLTSAKDAVS